MSMFTAFPLPVSFVLERVLPTGAELAWGYRHGWVSAEGAVAIALAKLEAGIYLPAPEEEVALLLSDDLDRVQQLLEDLEFVDEPVERRARLWLFLALAHVFSRRCEFEDPLGVVEDLYALFEYPDEIQGLVRYMQAPVGEPMGVDAVMQRWAGWVASVGHEYRRRGLMQAD